MKFAAASIALASVVAFPAMAGASTTEHQVDAKLMHGGQTTAEIAVDIPAGALVHVYTSDRYTGRSLIGPQLNERVHVFGIGADGPVLLGTTPDLADGVDDASTSGSWTAPASFTGLRVVLHEDQSSPNSLHVRMATVAPAPEPIPAPTIPEPTVPVAPAPADPVVDLPIPTAPGISIACERPGLGVVTVTWPVGTVHQRIAVNGMDPTLSTFPAEDGAAILATATFEGPRGTKVDASAVVEVDCPPATVISSAPSISAPPAKPVLPVTGASTLALVGMISASGALILGGSMLTRAAHR